MYLDYLVLGGIQCVCVCMCVRVCTHVCPLFMVIILCICSCKGVKIHGTTYKQGSVIRITSDDEQEDLPFVYAQITAVRSGGAGGAVTPPSFQASGRSPT